VLFLFGASYLRCTARSPEQLHPAGPHNACNATTPAAPVPTLSDLSQAAAAYEDAFGVPAPFPIGISDAYMIEVFTQAVRDGQPIPVDFGWWDYLPPGAVS
jgi:hypothetical protein